MSNTHQKVFASTVNCFIVLMLSLPFYVLWPDRWKVMAVILCFAYHLIFRRRCPGLLIAGTYNERPVSTIYAALYSLGFSTTVFSVLIPLDLMFCYGVAQGLCHRITGNTIPAWLTSSRTLYDRKQNEPASVPRSRGQRRT